MSSVWSVKIWTMEDVGVAVVDGDVDAHLVERKNGRVGVSWSRGVSVPESALAGSVAANEQQEGEEASSWEICLGNADEAVFCARCRSHRCGQRRP